MKRFEGILICSDLDGTLLTSNLTVSRENLAAIEYFQREGGRFTFVTGRMPSCVGEIYQTVRPNAPFGCINGGGLYDGEAKRYLWTHSLSDEALTVAEDVLASVPGVGIQLDTFEDIWFCRDNGAMEWFRQITGVPHLTAGLREVKDPLAKIVFADMDLSHMEQLRAFLAKHPMAAEFDFVSTERILYELLPKGSNKGAVLPRLAAHLGIDMSHVVALGDYNNDVEMLRTAGVGIAVANAVPEAKAAADRITVSNDEHALARVIGELDDGTLVL